MRKLFLAVVLSVASVARAQVTAVTVYGPSSGMGTSSAFVTFSVVDDGKYGYVNYDVLFSNASSPTTAAYSSFLGKNLVCGSYGTYFFNDNGSKANTVVQNVKVPNSLIYSGHLIVTASEYQPLNACGSAFGQIPFTITGLATFTPTPTPTKTLTPTPTFTPVFTNTPTFTPTAGPTQEYPFKNPGSSALFDSAGVSFGTTDVFLSKNTIYNDRTNIITGSAGSFLNPNGLVLGVDNTFNYIDVTPHGINLQTNGAGGITFLAGGGTFFAHITGNGFFMDSDLNFQNFVHPVNVIDPFNPQDGATKHYVDGKFPSVSGIFKQADTSAVTVASGLITGFAATSTPTATFTSTPTITNTPTPGATAYIPYVSNSGVKNLYSTTGNQFITNKKLLFGNSFYTEENGLGPEFVGSATSGIQIEDAENETGDVIGMDGSAGNGNIYLNDQSGGGILFQINGVTKAMVDNIGFNAQSHQVRFVAAPGVGTDAANKTYVDGIYYTGSVTLNAGAATVTGLTGVTSGAFPIVSYQTNAGTVVAGLRAVAGSASITINAGASDTSIVNYFVIKK